MMKKFLKSLIFCIVMIFVAGCASSPTSRFYTLSSTSAPDGTPHGHYSVSVGPVSVPAMVDRSQLVLRTGPNKVFIDEFDRWASPLKDNIQRVIVENLMATLGTTQITMFPRSIPSDGSYRTVINILHFDSEPGKATTLDALWEVSLPGQGPLRRGRTTVTEPLESGGFDALVAAHSRALGQLSAEIAGAIRELEARNP